MTLSGYFLDCIFFTIIDLGFEILHLIMSNFRSQEQASAKGFGRLFVFSAQFVSSFFPHPSPGLSSWRNNFC